MEPDWEKLAQRLKGLTMKQLRKVGGRWFSGMMGGASAKGEYVQTMVGQMRYWCCRAPTMAGASASATC